MYTNIWSYTVEKVMKGSFAEYANLLTSKEMHSLKFFMVISF